MRNLRQRSRGRRLVRHHSLRTRSPLRRERHLRDAGLRRRNLRLRQSVRDQLRMRRRLGQRDGNVSPARHHRGIAVRPDGEDRANVQPDRDPGVHRTRRRPCLHGDHLRLWRRSVRPHRRRRRPMFGGGGVHLEQRRQDLRSRRRRRTALRHGPGSSLPASFEMHHRGTRRRHRGELRLSDADGLSVRWCLTAS